jgi:hypothetical protein
MISFEQYVEVCRYFQFERLKRLVSEESDDADYERLIATLYEVI